MPTRGLVLARATPAPATAAGHGNMVPVNPAAATRPRTGDVLELTAGEVVHGGWCVARPDDRGQVVFVRHALPGERIRAVITQVTTKLAENMMNTAVRGALKGTKI